MEALFGAAGAEIFLLKETKAGRATSEVALGRPSLVGSQRKWKITLSPGDSPVFSGTLLPAPPSCSCTSASYGILLHEGQIPSVLLTRPFAVTFYPAPLLEALGAGNAIAATCGRAAEQPQQAEMGCSPVEDLQGRDLSLQLRR